MRKEKFLTVFIVILGYLVMFTTSSYPISINDLEEEEFLVILYCDDDAGSYCGKGQIRVEDFTFEDNGQFVIGTFEDENFFGFNTASGEYKETGILFNAEFSAIEDLEKKYEFDIIGLAISDMFILGVCQVIFFEFEITKLDYVKEDEAQCYFIGYSK